MLLTVMAAILPALAGVSTMWQAHAGLGVTGQVFINLYEAYKSCFFVLFVLFVGNRGTS